MDGQALSAIEVIALSVPIEQATVTLPTLRNRGQSSRFALIVSARTQDGLVGRGYFTVLGADPVRVAGEVERLAEPLLGTPAWAVDASWEAMFRLTHRQFRTRGETCRAISLIDAALWDLNAKRVGMPLHRLWGGHTDQLPMIVVDTSAYPDESDGDLGDRMERFRCAGYAGVKFKVGAMSGRGVDRDAERGAVVRQAAGPGFAIIADANQGWTVPEALRFLKRTQELELAWLEEPCIWTRDRDAMAQVRAAGLGRICAGQMEYTVRGCADLIEAGSIDVCNFDASNGGGATAWRRMASVASVHDVEVVCHVEPQVGAHLAASVTGGLFAEMFEPAADPFFSQMVANARQPKEGLYTLPEEPGWGLELDEDFIRKYRAN